MSKDLSLAANDEFFKVTSYYEGRKLKVGIGYMRGDFVYPYRGKLDKKAVNIPFGVYKNKDGEHIFIEPVGRERDMFHTKNVIELDPERIFNEVSDRQDNFVDPDDIELINNSKDIFETVIHESDDFLKRAVKEMINSKQISLKNYKGVFDSQYKLNNLKSALNKGKMSPINFETWCEIMGIKWTLTLEDNGEDRRNPLGQPIVMSSDD